MSLKIYINEEEQDFRKEYNNNILLDIQVSRTFALLPISGASYSGSLTSATSVKLIKIQLDSPFSIIEEITLPNSVITYSNGQFKVDQDVDIGVSLDECVYYLEFENGENKYKSEAFLVQVINNQLSADNNFWTADSTLITADQTNLEK